MTVYRVDKKTWEIVSQEAARVSGSRLFLYTYRSPKTKAVSAQFLDSREAIYFFSLEDAVYNLPTRREEVGMSDLPDSLRVWASWLESSPRHIHASRVREAANEIERLRDEMAAITEEHARVWMRVHEQEKEIERLRQVISDIRDDS